MSAPAPQGVRGLLARILEPGNLWRVCLLSLAGQTLYSLMMWREAFIYGAHRYFAWQVLDGLDPYSISGCVPEAPAAMLHFLPPRLLAHTAIFWTEDLTGWPIYLLVQWLALVAAVLAVRHLVHRKILEVGVAQALYLLLAFNPGLVSSSIILLGDNVVLIPVTLAVLAATDRSPALGAFLAGLSVGWHVPLILLGPVVVTHGLRQGAGARGAAQTALSWLVGGSLCLVPLFFAGHVGLLRWLGGEWQVTSWFSIWSALGPYFIPPMNLGAMTMSVAVLVALFAASRLSLRGAVILGVVLPELFSAHGPISALLVAGILLVCGFADVRAGRMVGAVVWCEAQILVLWHMVNGHLLDDRFKIFMVDHQHGLLIDAMEALILWGPVLLGAGWILRNQWRASEDEAAQPTPQNVSPRTPGDVA